MKRFNIVTTPTKVHNVDLHYNTIYGKVDCMFIDRITKPIQHKNGSIAYTTVTRKNVHAIEYYTYDRKPRMYQGHIYYALYVYMPANHRFSYTEKYHKEFTPIYDIIYNTIVNNHIYLKPITAHVTHSYTPGAPQAKKAQVDYDLKANMHSTAIAKIRDDSAVNNDTNVKIRAFVTPTGFQEKTRKIAERKPYTHSTKEFTEVQKIMTQNLRQYNKYWKEA